MNYKLSKKLKEESSVEYLDNYLKKERPRPLKYKKIQLIKKVIEEQSKINNKEAWIYLKSDLWDKAIRVLAIKKRAGKQIRFGKITYTAKSAVEVLLTMHKLNSLFVSNV